MNFILNLFLSNFFLQWLFFIISLYGGRRYTLPPFLSYSQFFTYSPLPVPFQEELVGIGCTPYFTFTGNNSSPFFLISPPFINFILLGNIYIFLRISANFAAILSNFAYISRNSQIFYLLFLLTLFSYFQLINMSYNPWSGW